MTWTEQRVAKLRQLHAQDLPFRQIAAELGGVTRNAVIGMARRLGLTARSTGPRTGSVVLKRKPRQLAEPCAPKRQFHPFKPMPPSPRQVAAPIEIDQQPSDQPVTLFDLEPHHCRWPIGDPILFCGGTKLDGQSYCEHHCRVAYVPYRRRG